MKKKEVRILGFNVLVWTWKDEKRPGAKGKSGIGLILEKVK